MSKKLSNKFTLTASARFTVERREWNETRVELRYNDFASTLPGLDAREVRGLAVGQSWKCASDPVQLVTRTA